MSAVAVERPRAFAVWWRDLDRWVVPSGTLLSGALPAGWARRRVGDVVKLISNVVKVDPTAEYRMAGVKWYGEGVFHRETVRGEGISARYLAPLVPRALIYNRLFAWKASFAVVPVEHSGCFVSNEFPQFGVDPAKLLPEYLYLWCISERTIRAVSAASTGSAAVSRNRFRENYFLDFEMLLPPLAAQRRIVAAWEAAQKSAAATAAKIERLEYEMEARFLADLGLTAAEKNSVPPKAFALPWRALDRWSVIFNQLASTAVDLARSKYPVARLGDVATVSYGVQKSPANRPSEHPRPYLRVANVQRGELDLREIKYIDVPDEELKSLRLELGDVLFVEGNGSKAELGRCALWRGEIADCVHQNHILKVRPGEALSSEYMTTWFNTEVGKDHFFRSAKTSSGLGTINSSELRAAPIPLPPASTQRQIVRRVAQARAEIAKLKQDANAHADSVKSDLEGMILGSKPVH